MGWSSLPVLGPRGLISQGFQRRLLPCFTHLLGVLVLINFWQHHFNLYLCLNLPPPLCLYFSFSGSYKDTAIELRAHPKPTLSHSVWTYTFRGPVSQDCHILRVCVKIYLGVGGTVCPTTANNLKPIL